MSAPAAFRPIPYEVTVRHLTRPELYRALDMIDRAIDRHEREGRPDLAADAERRREIAWDELDRRNAAKREPEAKKEARIRAEAAQWYAARDGGRS